MRLIKGLWLVCLVLAAGSLALAYGLAGLWQWSAVFGALGAGWWLGRIRLGQWASLAGLVGLVLGAMVGLWLGTSPLWMLAVTALALAAWDLDAFEQRLVDEPPDPLLQKLVRAHLNKLLVVVVIGFGVAVLVMSLRTRLNFWVLVGAALLLALSLSRAFLLMSR